MARIVRGSFPAKGHLVKGSHRKLNISTPLSGAVNPRSRTNSSSTASPNTLGGALLRRKVRMRSQTHASTQSAANVRRSNILIGIGAPRLRVSSTLLLTVLYNIFSPLLAVSSSNIKNINSLAGPDHQLHLLRIFPRTSLYLVYGMCPRVPPCHPVREFLVSHCGLGRRRVDHFHPPHKDIRALCPNSMEQEDIRTAHSIKVNRAIALVRAMEQCRSTRPTRLGRYDLSGYRWCMRKS